MRTVLLSLSILLLIGTSASQDKTYPIKVEKKNGENVTFSCKVGEKWTKNGIHFMFGTDISLQYKDDESGKYECWTNDTDVESQPRPDPIATYYVKFRTCDSCIELDWGALTGMIIGNVVATILIGVAVYFISIQSKGPSFPSNKASQESDRRNLIPNDSTYQSLNNHGRDAYEVLNTRRR